MRADRLRYLASEILPYVEPRHFNMNYWGVFWNEKKQEWVGEVTNPKSGDCKTFACAFGYMCASTKGKKEGLHFIPGGVMYRSPNGIPYKDYEAVSVYFELDIEMSRWIFDSDHYDIDEYAVVGPVDVAVRIETLLAAEG